MWCCTMLGALFWNWDWYNINKMYYCYTLFYTCILLTTCLTSHIKLTNTKEHNYMRKCIDKNMYINYHNYLPSLTGYRIRTFCKTYHPLLLSSVMQCWLHVCTELSLPHIFCCSVFVLAWNKNKLYFLLYSWGGG